MSEVKKKKMNLPNRITLIRVFLLPLIVIVPLLAQINPETNFLNKDIIINKDTIKKMAELNMWIDQNIDFYSPWHFKKLINKFDYED